MYVFRSAIAAVFAVLIAVGGVNSATSAEYNWSGSYIGVVGSGGMYTVEQEDYWCWWSCDAPTLQDWQASIGAQAGHNWQNGNFVFGVVGDISTGFEDSTGTSWSAGNSRAEYGAEWNYYATLRAKAGLAAGNALVYGTAGIAIVDVDYTAVGTNDYNADGFDCSLDVDCASVNDTKVGFAAGLGVGYPISDNITLGFEYLYIGLPWDKDRWDADEVSNPTDTDDYVSWTTSAHLARVSVVWNLN